MTWVIVLVIGLSSVPRHAIFEGIGYPDQKTCMKALSDYVAALKDEPAGTGLCVPVTPAMTQPIGKDTQL